jgi:tetraprenyl-beta-curcumene synthase
MLLRIASRALLVGLPAAAGEMRRWRARAQAAVEPELREDALMVLRQKRTHVDGAAMFSTLLPGKQSRLRRLLVAYELAVDFLDYTSERAQTTESDYRAGARNGQRLHAALLNAIDARTALVDYYALHPWSDDAGYLQALVLACREGTSSLPSYPRAQAIATKEAARAAEILAINHIPDEQLRDEEMKAWAARHFTAEEHLAWFELAAAVSGALAIHGLLAQAADAHANSARVCEAHHAYLCWVALATAMLDSHADRLEDASTAGHSYVAHYGDAEKAQTALLAIVQETLCAVRKLPRGQKHAILVGSMIAMYLSKDDARSPQLAAETRELVNAGGPLIRSLLPALRAWRVFFSHQSA